MGEIKNINFPVLKKTQQQGHLRDNQLKEFAGGVGKCIRCPPAVSQTAGHPKWQALVLIPQVDMLSEAASKRPMWSLLPPHMDVAVHMKSTRSDKSKTPVGGM